MLSRLMAPWLVPNRATVRSVHKALQVTLVVGVIASTLNAQAPAGGVKRPRPSSSGVAQPALAPLSVTGAIVLADMTVRPLPLLALEIASTTDSTKRVELRTGLDGKVVRPLTPGAYRLRSTSDVVLEGKRYRWDVSVEIAPPGTTVELTNANAVVDVVQQAGGEAPPKSRQVAPERGVFEASKRGVFRVESGLGHGTGFLVDSLGGLVVTNDHVIGTATNVSVYLDSMTRVPAQVVVRDANADLALLRLPAGRCADCPKLKLASPAPGDPLVVAGERLLAIGFPLTQEMTLTSGIVSSIRDGAIMSDVAINPGNSGGPMLNLAGEVVGVNTFGDKSERVGQGISGSVSVQRLGPLFAKAPEAIANLPVLEDRTLPAFPQAVYSTTLLKQVVDTTPLTSYRKLLKGKSAGNFDIAFMTPPLFMAQQLALESEVAKDRKKRERRAGIAESERYTEMSEIREWLQYVGTETAPVIAVIIRPKIGETFWSSFGRAVQQASIGVSSAAKLKFMGDVRGARFYRNGVEIEPLRGGHAPQKVYIDQSWVELKDVADLGYYVLPVEAVQPDSSGVPARLHVVVRDLKNPQALAITDISGDVTARLWNDFVPFLETQRPGEVVVRANQTLKSPKVGLDCDVQTAGCTVKEKQ
jgi:S1-C subfamily serine protease